MMQEQVIIKSRTSYRALIERDKSFVVIENRAQILPGDEIEIDGVYRKIVGVDDYPAMKAMKVFYR